MGYHLVYFLYSDFAAFVKNDSVSRLTFFYIVLQVYCHYYTGAMLQANLTLIFSVVLIFPVVLYQMLQSIEKYLNKREHCL